MKITVGIPVAYRNQATILYWEAFGEKLGVVLGPKKRALKYIASVLRPDHAICAFDDAGCLLGVAGFKTAHGALVGGGYRDMRRVYGAIGAGLRVWLLAILERDVENERFLMDGLFVAPQARSQGVGTALLDAICDEAKQRGFTQVRLDVIDSNTRAKALYTQVGFREIKTFRMGLLRFIFGFNASSAMVRDIYPTKAN